MFFLNFQEPGAAEESIRDLPPSAIGEASGYDAKGFAVANKGKSLEAIVEQVRDGSTVRVYLLPSFQFVQIYVAGVQVCLSWTLLSTIVSFFMFRKVNVD
jgi:staphylococcal nuclease domain-containing protein 1